MDYVVTHVGRTVAEVEWVIVQSTVPVALFFVPAAPFVEQVTHEAGHRELHAASFAGAFVGCES
eukprot:15333255-Alexandrium_andersonii.AAC.1